MRILGLILAGVVALAAIALADPIESLVAVVPEGFWRFTFHTEEGDQSWCVFVSADTCITEDELEVGWADTATAVIWFAVPALECTAFTFVDPPWPDVKEDEHAGPVEGEDARALSGASETREISERAAE